MLHTGLGSLDMICSYTVYLNFLYTYVCACHSCALYRCISIVSEYVDLRQCMLHRCDS